MAVGAAPGGPAPAGPLRGAPEVCILPPFGLDPGILDLALSELRAALAAAGLRPTEAQLLLAAHGSFKSPAPSAVARRLARAIVARLPMREVRTAFIDQSPRLAEATGFGPEAFCLPFFAAAGGHVEADLPQALADAGFAGRVLRPLGLCDGAPRLVAEALRAAAGTD